MLTFCTYIRQVGKVKRQYIVGKARVHVFKLPGLALALLLLLE